MRWNLLLTSFLTIFLCSLPAHAGQLLFWRFNQSSNQLEFRTNAGVQPKTQLLANPARLIIDLPGTTLQRPTVTQPLNGAIRSLRVGQFDRNTTRLVIELNPGYTLDPQQVIVRGQTAQQWLVQLPNPQIQTSDRGGNSLGPQQIQPILPPIAQVVPSTPIQRSDRRVVVMVDPGHGGKDPGAIGIGGLQEKDVILSISQQVAALLEKQGIQAIMTRDSDYFVALAPRVEMARQAGANLFVSIHANSISNRPDVNGLETYYYGIGKPLAETIHNSILQNININNRRVREARFYVLRNSAIPATLVEVGFVTGTQDAPKLGDSTYQSEMASAIAKGIIQYIQQNL